MRRNSAQETCIRTIDGQVIVIACPGAGKTTTLLERIRYMVKENHIPPEHILMMTFTRAAAVEMKKRYEAEPGSEKGVTFCTIHALCLSLLIRYEGKPEIIQEAEAKNFFFQFFRDCVSKYPTMQIPTDVKEKLSRITDKEAFINDLILDISVHKNNPGKQFPLNSTSDRLLFTFLWDAYESLKKEQNKIDFDDMLTRTYELLLRKPEILQTLRHKYQYIQVDEYQDTNYIQRDIIYLLAGENGNLAVVGDDDQSIYGFRGAQPEIMLGFPTDYPHAKVIKMGTNYRSATTIVSHAGRMIAKNQNRYEKEFVAAKHEKGDIELTILDRQEEEYNQIADRIEKLLQKDVQDSQIAVLYRTNREAEGVASALSRREIVFQVADGITNRYEHWIMKDIIAYYRLSQGIGERKDLYRVLNHPQRYLTEGAFFQIDAYFDLSEESEKAMRMLAYQSMEPFWKINQMTKEIGQFFRLLRSLKGKQPRDFLYTLKTVYWNYLKDYVKFRGIDLEELTNVWDSYMDDIQHLSIEKPCNWDTWMDYIRRYEHGIQNARKSKTGVLLSSMHKSKGLEWEYVLIANCVHGMIPYMKKQQPCNMEEERRLFYVACTRAKKHLELFAFKTKGDKKMKLSSFIREMNS